MPVVAVADPVDPLESGDGTEGGALPLERGFAEVQVQPESALAHDVGELEQRCDVERVRRVRREPRARSVGIRSSSARTWSRPWVCHAAFSQSMTSQ